MGFNGLKDMTIGNETSAIIRFAIPMALGNVFQQLYNITDTLIVGRFVGPGALAAVGSSYTLMIFLTSIIIGLCIGSSVVFSYFFGSRERDSLQRSIFMSFFFIGAITVVINVLVIAFIHPILKAVQIPSSIMEESVVYTKTVFFGIGFIFIYNYFAAIMRSMGNSVVPLFYLIISTAVNIVLDIVFVVFFGMGIFGAAFATVIAQAMSALGIAISCIKRIDVVRIAPENRVFDKEIFVRVRDFSVLSSIQQSIMNFGILMIQGLVNSFGVVVMAGFAAAVKIDTLAYVPVSDFGNAFSTFIAQNKGANRPERISRGTKSAIMIIAAVCIPISIAVFVFADYLMMIFVEANNADIIAVGARYLRIEGSFYILIGYLFMFYGMFRGWGKPSMSIILTILSLGTRVVLAYSLSPMFGTAAIWWAIPIGWAIADIYGAYRMCRYRIL